MLLKSVENCVVRVFLWFNIFLVWLQLGLWVFFVSFLPSEVPVFYTHSWGQAQLSSPRMLLLVPILGIFFLIGNLVFSEIFWRARENLLSYALWGVVTVVEGVLGYSLVRIISISASGFEVTLTARMFIAASLACFLSLIFSPLAVKFARLIKAVDDPVQHRHPAILHWKTVPRAGSLAFLGAFLAASFLFLPLTKKLVGVYVGAIIAAVLGVLDDRGASGKSRELSPYLRLGGQVVMAGVVVAAGIGITFFQNPFGGIIRLDTIDIPIHFLGEHHILLLADIFALVWMVWVMNLLSWSNGVDGQFSGITFITCLVLALLSSRFVGYDPIQGQTAVLAAICGGAALGLLPATWHPAKIFWGFGATGCGLIIASLSILSGAKVATAVLVLLVPLLDAVVTISRRVLRGQSPVWGDREHLHHHLLSRGFTQRQVAVFYWFLTGICGVLALCTAGKSKVLMLLMVGGVVGFILVLINFKGKSFKDILDS